MRTIKPTIVVFGCTGTVGTEVMRQLQYLECNVRGVLRTANRTYPIPLSSTPSNITYISANLTDKAQLRNACFGADAIFLLTATSPKQVDYEINIIDAAKHCGVRRIVKLSAPVIQPSAYVEVSQWHHQIDNYLIDQMEEYCCLRPHSFMQNWERNTFAIQYFGKIYATLGTAKRNYVDARDVATVAVNYLLEETEVRAISVCLAGPQAISNQEMASKLSLVTGREIEYINLTPEELFKQLSKRAKLPMWLANHIVELDNLSILIPEPITDSITNLIGRKPRTMDEYLQENRHYFNRKPLWKMLF
ncbi:NAD(P)H-binding protein [Myroides sp. N17-2]|uniref:NmrA family NAD(P)-binding protein n=1 Tax=Myroides sp. N17-2 TaxID=2030799 RepID=UPI000EFC8D3D|nr:NmrA family NAD(P)-binding protein [Myroides sp. N17-2]